MNMFNRLHSRAQRICQQRRDLGLFRQCTVLETPQQVCFRVKGRDYIGFCSNDYLGLANSDLVSNACLEGIAQYGVGAGSAHLINGHSQAHEELECLFAQFVGAEDAVLFSTGYMANIGVLQALVQRQDILLCDRLNHASLIDAAQLTRAKVKRYNTLLDLDEQAMQGSAQHWLITDGVFSMDGFAVSVSELLGLADRTGSFVYVDDAHGFGVLGEGKGLFSGIQDWQRNAVYMATLGKAIGVSGALVAGQKCVIDAIRQQARSWVYTTAMPPALSVAVAQVLRWIDSAQGAESRARLFDNCQQLHAGLLNQGWRVLPTNSAIISVLMGEVDAAVKASAQLKECGFWVPAIRPPTVPQGSARLRFTVSATHTHEQIDSVLCAMNTLRVS